MYVCICTSRIVGMYVCMYEGECLKWVSLVALGSHRGCCMYGSATLQQLINTIKKEKSHVRNSVYICMYVCMYVLSMNI